MAKYTITDYTTLELNQKNFDRAVKRLNEIEYEYKQFFGELPAPTERPKRTPKTILPKELLKDLEKMDRSEYWLKEAAA